MFAAAPDASAAKIRYIEMLLDREKFEQAGKALASIKGNDSPKLAMLRVRVVRETGKTKEALKLVNDLIAKGKPTPSLIIEKAKLQVEGRI